MAGKYEVVGDALRFTPRFALRPGLTYRADFFPPPPGPQFAPARITKDIAVPCAAAARADEGRRGVSVGGRAARESTAVLSALLAPDAQGRGQRPYPAAQAGRKAGRTRVLRNRRRIVGHHGHAADAAVRSRPHQAGPAAAGGIRPRALAGPEIHARHRQELARRRGPPAGRQLREAVHRGTDGRRSRRSQAVEARPACRRHARPARRPLSAAAGPRAAFAA